MAILKLVIFTPRARNSEGIWSMSSGLFMKSNFEAEWNLSFTRTLTGSVQMKMLHCFHNFFASFFLSSSCWKYKAPCVDHCFQRIQCFQMLQLLKCETGCLWDHPSLSSSKPHFSLSLAMLLSLQYATEMRIWCLPSSQDKCVCSKRLLFGD